MIYYLSLHNNNNNNTIQFNLQSLHRAMEQIIILNIVGHLKIYLKKLLNNKNHKQ